MEPDWERIRAQYIAGTASCRELAMAHGLQTSQVARRCRQEGWQAQRRQGGPQERLEVLMELSQRLCAVVERALADEEQFYRYVVQRNEQYAEPVEDDQGHLVTKRRWTEVQTLPKVDTKALGEITGTLQRLTGLIRDLWERPGVREAHRMRLEEQRLELAKQKDCAQGAQIVIGEEAGDWAQ